MAIGWETRTWATPLLALPLLLPYPPLEWGAWAWVALAPLLFALKHAPGDALRWTALGWGFGILFYGFQYGWLHRTMVELGGLSLPAFAGFLAAALTFLGAFTAVTCGLTRLAWRRLGLSPYIVFPILFALHDALLGVVPFGGAPWGSLAATQTASLAARVLAPLAGGPAVVLAIAAANAGWAWAAEGLLRDFRLGARRAVLAGLLTALLAPAWPSLPTIALPDDPPAGAPPAGEPFTALLVPGNFSNAAFARGGEPRFRSYLSRTLAALSRQQEAARPEPPGEPRRPGAARPPVRLVLWPESALKGRLEQGQRLAELSSLASLFATDFLLGSNSRRGGRDFNTAYLVPGGAVDFPRYDKRRLVPFGEYVPPGFRWFLAAKLTAGEADFTAGSAPPVLEWRNLRLGLGICFESILPGHMRAAALEGAEVMAILANDHWLTPPAATHHLRLTALRGLEIGREVLFVSNGGWSALLAGGRVVAARGREGRPLAVRAHPSTRQTPWVRWGYLPFSLLLAAFALAGPAAAALKKSRGRHGQR